MVGTEVARMKEALPINLAEKRKIAGPLFGVHSLLPDWDQMLNTVM